jgi:hypothetical protein
LSKGLAFAKPKSTTFSLQLLVNSIVYREKHRNKIWWNNSVIQGVTIIPKMELMPETSGYVSHFYRWDEARFENGVRQ